MDVNARIRQLMDKQDWSEYRLAKEAGLSQSTIANIFKRDTVPNITTLESICTAFGISLSHFFHDGVGVELSDEQNALLEKWGPLSQEQKKIVMDVITNMKRV